MERNISKRDLAETASQSKCDFYLEQ